VLSVLYFWLGLGLGPELNLVIAGLGLEAKNYGLGLGLVNVALTSALASCTYGLVNIPVLNRPHSIIMLSVTGCQE